MPKVHEHTFDAEKRAVAARQLPVVRADEFYMAGGTALALRLGHRTSVDIDWFTPKAFDAKRLVATLSEQKEKPTSVEINGPHTVRAYYGAFETSFIRYTQIPAESEMLSCSPSLEIPVGKMGLLAGMKSGAVFHRGQKKDFVDVYAISRQPGWSVSRFIQNATEKLPIPPAEMARALLYFRDAEASKMPENCSVTWDAVKKHIERGVRDWEKSLGRGLER